MGTWSIVTLIVVLAIFAPLLAWLIHLGVKLRDYVVQAGEATKLLREASARAQAEFPPEPAQGKHRATENGAT